jgi:5-methylcytosine-specific restriction endonuclease McrA
MPNWNGSDRRSRLPADWPKIRTRILRRDMHRCTHITNGIRCNKPATEVDHIRRGDDHSERNLRSLCSECHATKSGREGAAAFHANRRRNDKRFRRHEEHPGLLK